MPKVQCPRCGEIVDELVTEEMPEDWQVSGNPFFSDRDDQDD